METEINTYHEFDLSNRFFWLATVLVAGLVVYFLMNSMYYFKTLPQNYPNQLSVTGDGKAFVKPDIATVSFGVHSESAKSQDAVNKNNDKMNAVIKAIKNLGVAEKDIQTTSYNLSPMYGYVGRPISAPSIGMMDYPVVENKVTGYSLDQQVTVKIRNFDKINDILDGATSSGANTVGSLQFTVDDPVKAQGEARAKAIANAKEKAMSMVSQAGLHIDKLVNIMDGNQGYVQPMYSGMSEMPMDAKTVAPQIQTGQQEVDASVTLTYLLK